jgi:hypothetical protein
MILDDLTLHTYYTSFQALTHAATMTSLTCHHLVDQHPGISFIHISPGMAGTNLLKNLGISKLITAPIMFLLKPFFVPLSESGERYLYAATNETFTSNPRRRCHPGWPTTPNKGSYLLGWDNRELADKKALRKYKQRGFAELIWKHTLHVFEIVCEEKRGSVIS